MTKEEIIEEFETTDKLIGFVLEDCMDMKWEKDFDCRHPRIGYGIHNTSIDTSKISLSIYTDFDMEKLYYLDNLMKIGFDVSIYYLLIDDKVTDISNPQFLENIDKINILIWPKDIKIPQLPSSITKIKHKRADFAIIGDTPTEFDRFFRYYTNIPRNKEELDSYNSMWKNLSLPEIKRYILDKITKGEIRV